MADVINMPSANTSQIVETLNTAKEQALASRMFAYILLDLRLAQQQNNEEHEKNLTVLVYLYAKTYPDAALDIERQAGIKIHLPS